MTEIATRFSRLFTVFNMFLVFKFDIIFVFGRSLFVDDNGLTI